jgi:RNA ligase
VVEIPVRIDELFDYPDLMDEVRAGYVAYDHHPKLPYRVWCYTQKTKTEKHWNFITTKLRGLITDIDGNVISRPFDRFGGGPVDWADEVKVEVTDKIDGAMCVLYPNPWMDNGWALATRNSFVDARCQHATNLYYENYPNFNPRPHLTYIFELVCPLTRNVVNYGRDDNLYLVAIRDTATGVYLSVKDGHVNTHRTSVFPYKTYGEFKGKHRHPAGTEGVVIRNLETQELTTVKSEEWRKNHLLMKSLNAVAVWDAMYDATPTDFTRFKSWYPAYLHDWVDEVAYSLQEDSFNLYQEIFSAWSALEPVVEDRKQFARVVMSDYAHLSVYLFTMLDSRPVERMIWEAVRPSGDWRPVFEEE